MNISDRGLPAGVWLDATVSETVGKWMWMATDQVMAYDNWNDWEPNGGIVNYCLMIYPSDGKWNDENCAAYYSSVCEI